MLRYCFLAFLLSVCAFASAQDVPKGLPVVYISTADGSPVTGRDWRQGTRVRICRADGSTDYEGADAAVKAHGNSSFQKPKKPLTLKLGSPVSVLGMTANTKWFFVSNFMGSLDPARFDDTGSFEASVANFRTTFLRRIEALDCLFAYGGRH